MELRKIRIVVAAFGVLIALYSLIFSVNYSELNWTANSSPYLQVITGVCVAVAMIFSNKVESKRLNEDK